MKTVLLGIAMLAHSVVAPPQAKVTIVRPSRQRPVPAPLRGELHRAVALEALLALPNRDTLVEYDTVRDNPGTADYMDNHVHVAIVRREKLIADFDCVSLAPAGPVGFHGIAISPVPSRSVAAVIALTLGTDGAASLFVFIGEKSQRYAVVGTLAGTQAQIRFSGLAGAFELWTADGWAGRTPETTCVWCPKYYRRTTYDWRNGTLQRLRTFRLRRAYSPGSFFEVPFVSTK